MKLKYGSQIKIANHEKQKIDKFNNSDEMKIKYENEIFN